MSQYFSELFERSGGNVKFGLDLSNYATKVDMKETGKYTETKTDLTSFKKECMTQLEISS